MARCHPTLCPACAPHQGAGRVWLLVAQHHTCVEGWRRLAGRVVSVPGGARGTRPQKSAAASTTRSPRTSAAPTVPHVAWRRPSLWLMGWERGEEAVWGAMAGRQCARWAARRWREPPSRHRRPTHTALGLEEVSNIRTLPRSPNGPFRAVGGRAESDNGGRRRSKQAASQRPRRDIDTPPFISPRSPLRRRHQHTRVVLLDTQAFILIHGSSTATGCQHNRPPPAPALRRRRANACCRVSARPRPLAHPGHRLLRPIGGPHPLHTIPHVDGGVAQRGRGGGEERAESGARRVGCGVAARVRPGLPARLARAGSVDVVLFIVWTATVIFICLV